MWLNIKKITLIICLSNKNQFDFMNQHLSLQHIANSMQNLGWDVQIDSFTEPNTVLGKAVNFKNVIATLDKNVSIYQFNNNMVKSYNNGFLRLEYI